MLDDDDDEPLIFAAAGIEVSSPWDGYDSINGGNKGDMTFIIHEHKMEKLENEKGLCGQ